MSNEIIKVLEYISDKLGIVVDWTSATALPYVTDILSKYVKYEIVNNSIGIGVGVIFLIIGVVLAVCLVKGCIKCKHTRKDNLLFEECLSDVLPTGIGMSAIIIAFLMLVVGFLVVLAAGDELLKWCITPEIVLLESIKDVLG